MSTTVERKYKCKCGEFEAKLTGDPYVCIVCHCHSCVACSRAIDEKNKGEGTTGLKNAGSAMAFYKAGNMEFVTDLKTDESRSKLGFVKVGEKGEILRVYTQCCNTQVLAFLAPTFAAFNTNCIYEQDGSSFEPHEPENNIMVKYAFDASVVPEPKSNMASFSTIIKLMPLFLLGGVLPFGPNLKEQIALFPAPDADVEVVPITWE